MVGPSALLDWLAPGAADRAGLERAIGLARALLAEDRPEGEGEGACVAAEYEAEVRRMALELCEGLFELHLESLGRPAVEGQGAGTRGGRAAPLWKALVELEQRGLDLALPSLPEPHETPEMVAGRVLLAAECLGLSAGRLALWRAHFAAAVEGPVRAVLHFEEVRGNEELDFETRVALECAVGHVLLSAGAIPRALDWAAGVLDLAAAEPRVRRVVGWVHAASGDLEAAAELGLPTAPAKLPACVFALGQHWPAARAVLSTPPDAENARAWQARGASPGWEGMERTELGAVLLAVVAVERCGRVVQLDHAPGLTPPCEGWYDRQEFVGADRRTPEGRVLESGEVWVGHPDVAGEPQARELARHCASPRTRAVALVPLVQGEGPRLGWLRLEFEHFMVPAPARLRRIAERWRQRLGVGRASTVAADPDGERLERLFSVAMRGFAIGRRRWYGLRWGASGAELVASGGNAFEAPSVALELGRDCLEKGRVVLAAELQGAVRSALAIPLAGGRYCLAVESSRQNDLDMADVDGLVMGERGDLRGLGWRLETTAFAAWHRQALGRAITPEWPGLSPVVEWLDTLPEGPRVLTGSAGSGKLTLARFCVHLAGETPRVWQAQGLDEEGFFEALEAPGAILRDVDKLGLDLQARWVHLLEQGRGAHLLATSRGRLDGLGQRLRECLLSGRVALPELRHRRAELPGCFEVALRRAARQQGCVAPTLTGDARALVWRQAWTRGLHEVHHVARRVVPLAAGQHLDAADLGGLVAELDCPFVDKLPTRDFDPRDLSQAVEGTRKKGGSIHRGRAAALLGWDPDTLSSKLAALGME